MVGEPHRPFSGPALGQRAQLLERRKRFSLRRFQGKAEAIPTHQHVPTSRQHGTDPSRVTVAPVRQYQVATPHGYSSIALPTVLIGQLEKVAPQIRQAQGVMDPPIGSRTSLLFDRGGIDHPNPPPLGQPFDQGRVAHLGHLRGQLPQPWLARPQPLKQRNVRNIGNRLLARPHHRLAQRQPRRRVHQNQLQQTIGVGDTSGSPKRPGAARLFAPVRGKKVREKLPLLIQ